MSFVKFEQEMTHCALQAWNVFDDPRGTRFQQENIDCLYSASFNQ